MTNLDKLLGEIHQLATAEADAVLASAEEEIEKIVSENKDRIERETSKIEDRAKISADSIVERGKSNQRILERNELLALKQKSISSTILEAKKTVIELEDDAYFSLLSKWAKRVDVTGKGTLFLNERDLKRNMGDFLKSFPDGLEVELSKQPEDISGGFLLVCGGITVNCSVDAVFDLYSGQINSKLQQILFS